MADIVITTSSKDYLDRSTNLIAQAFEDDPVFRFFASASSEEKHLANTRSLIYAILKAASLNQAQFQEANDWSCSAIWLLPETKIDGPITLLQAGLIQLILKLGLGVAKRLLLEYQAQVEKAKEKHFRGSKKYYYLLMMGTSAQHRGKGLASCVLREWQAKAQKDGLSIWLEATTSHSRDIYARCGFQARDVIRLGKGTHDEEGHLKAGGPGVPVWPMLWQPSP